MPFAVYPVIIWQSVTFDRLIKKTKNVCAHMHHLADRENLLILIEIKIRKPFLDKKSLSFEISSFSTLFNHCKYTLIEFPKKVPNRPTLEGNVKNKV